MTQTPQIAASPTSLDFRNSLPGISVERDLALTDTGTGPLQVTKVAFDNPAFTLISPTLPFTLLAGDSMTLQVTFTATSAGPAQGKMTITSNAATTPSLVIPLTATGITSVAPDAAVSPTSVDFGQVATGSTSKQTVSLQNFGPGPMQVKSVSVTGTGFTLASGLAQTPFSLGTESVSIGVQFAPTQAGAQTGSLTITTDDPAHASIVVSLRGTGTTMRWLSAAGPARSTVTFTERVRHCYSHRHASTGCTLTASSSAPSGLPRAEYRRGSGTVINAVAGNRRAHLSHRRRHI